VAEHNPEYAVICTATSEHFGTLEALAAAAFEGTVLIEKPVFASARLAPQNNFGAVYVAYNLRFHPAVQALRQRLEGERVLAIQAYVGQYLPSWRPGRDYREVYSAHRSLGGGVLRDLSHDLDYLNWILGGWTKATAIGGQLSSLEIERCPVASIHLNYVDRVTQRYAVVNTDAHTFTLSLTGSYLEIDGVRETFNLAPDDTYIAQHRAILSATNSDLCTLGEGVDVMALVEAAETSMRNPIWVHK
jgi:predicted dehydrogenase